MTTKWYKSTSFYGALFLAISLWVYTTLNKQSSKNISVPFELVLPENRALKSDIPNEIEVNILGTGWDLLFDSGVESVLDISNRELLGKTDKISKNDLLRSLKYLGAFEARTILTDEFDIEIGRIISKKVPVVSNFSITLADGFDLGDKMELKPDSIFIRGNEEVLSKIDFWQTKSYFFENVKDDIIQKVNLSDTLNNIISLNSKEVELFAPIEPLSNIEIPDLKVEIRNGSLDRNFKFYPNIVTVTLSGNIEEIQQIDPNQIEVYIDYNEIRNTNSTVFQPTVVSKNKKIKVINYEPKVLFLTEDLSKN